MSEREETLQALRSTCKQHQGESFEVRHKIEESLAIIKDIMHQNEEEAM